MVRARSISIGGPGGGALVQGFTGPGPGDPGPWFQELGGSTCPRLKMVQIGPRGSKGLTGKWFTVAKKVKGVHRSKGERVEGVKGGPGGPGSSMGFKGLRVHGPKRSKKIQVTHSSNDPLIKGVQGGPVCPGGLGRSRCLRGP